MAPYVFKAPQKDACAAQWIFQTMKDTGIRRIGVLASNDGFGLAGKEQLERYAPQAGIEIAAAEVYDKAATDLTGVLTKVKGRNVQAVVNWSIVPAQALVAKNMKQLGFDVPLFQSHGFGEHQVRPGRRRGGERHDLPGRAAARRRPAPGRPSAEEGARGVQEGLRGALSRGDASTFGGHAYDALMILAEAIEKAGSADPEKVRDAIENLQGVVGTAGIFNFSKTDHNGLGMEAFEMLTVKDGKFALYKK